MNTPTLIEMLKCGVHFGHRASKWHPNMAPYIFTTRNNVHILNLEITQKKLKEALNAVRALAAQGKIILFVGTKHQAQALVAKYAVSCGMPFMSTRWLGGLFTNFSEVSGLARQLISLKQQRESGALKKYTKKEQIEFDRDIERLQPMVGGIEAMIKLPDAVFIVDMKHEKTAVREAQRMQIPIFAITDTNVDPRLADYPIPANDDAIKSLDLILKTFAEAVEEGRQELQNAQIAAPQEGHAQATLVASAEDLSL